MNVVSKNSLTLLLAAFALTPFAASADSGFYIGGSVGGAACGPDPAIEAQVVDNPRGSPWHATCWVVYIPNPEQS